MSIYENDKKVITAENKMREKIKTSDIIERKYPRIIKNLFYFTNQS